MLMRNLMIKKAPWYITVEPSDGDELKSNWWSVDSHYNYTPTACLVTG